MVHDIIMKLQDAGILTELDTPPAADAVSELEERIEDDCTDSEHAKPSATSP